MTELEKKIYECAKIGMDDRMETIKKRLAEGVTTARIMFVFYCDGCWDRLLYDIEKDEFSIKYQKGVGDAAYSLGNGFSAYFDEVEWVEFKIPDKVFVI